MIVLDDDSLHFSFSSLLFLFLAFVTDPGTIRLSAGKYMYYI